MSMQRLFSALLLAGVAATSSQAAEVGVRTISVYAPDRGRDIAVTVWYPATDGGVPGLVGDNRLFKGVPARRDAPVAEGHFPLVLLSHGSGGRVEGMSWLASALAEAGFVVAGPNHPGTTSGDSTPAATPKIWERTADLSALIDRFSTDAGWRGAIDPARIGVWGSSYSGGHAYVVAAIDRRVKAVCGQVPLISGRRAFEMLVTGDFIDADTARQRGLVNRVAPPEQLDAEVQSLLASIVDKPRAALEMGKALFYRQLETGLDDALKDAGRTMACNMMDEAALEGVLAFVEKRKPDWR